MTGMTHVEMWREVIRVLAAYSVLTYWYCFDEPEFCWAIDDADDICEDRVLGSLNPDEPLYYHSINSAVVVREHIPRPGQVQQSFPADRWERLTCELRGVQGLRVAVVRNFEVCGLPAVSEALQLTAAP
jgi:hypothetical protein